MRRIQLRGKDVELFAHDLDETDLEFYHRHKDTFKRMWQDQGKNFWVRYIISFRWHIVNHGVLSEFPGKKEVFDAIVDQAFIYIHENFVDGKLSQAHGLLQDIFVLAVNKGAIKYLEGKTMSRDPFFFQGTREVFRKIFGDPANKITYIKLYFTFPMFVSFGGSLVQCLKRWIDAPELAFGDDSYWEPPQKNDPPVPRRSINIHGNEKKKKRPKKITATTDGHTIDDDYKIYLEEKLKGHRFGPVWLANWDFGDPRFVDAKNPLYNLRADPKSDWRVDLTFDGFRKFYDYVKTNECNENWLSLVYMCYHPDVVVYPPPPNRRVYDEIERSFLKTCEKYYNKGIKILDETLPVEDYFTKDIYVVMKYDSRSHQTTLVDKEPLPHPTPNVFPQLESGSCLLVLRKHIDGRGAFEKFMPNDVKMQHPGQVMDHLSEFGHQVDQSGDNKYIEKTKQIVEGLQIKTPLVQPTEKQRKRKSKKPKSEDVSNKWSAKEEVTIKAVNGATGGKAVSTEKPQVKQALTEESDGSDVDLWDESLSEYVLENDWIMSNYPNLPVNYPKSLEEMKVVPIDDIEPQTFSIFNLLCMEMGGIELLDIARRKATLICPDCHDEYTYGRFTDIKEREMIDTMSLQISQQWRAARHARKQAKQNPTQTKPTLGDNYNSKKCKAQEKIKVTSAVSTLRNCTICQAVESKPKDYKKCQRCKEEGVKEPRYYCSVNCQAADWKEKHRTEHNENLLEIETE